MNSVNFGNDGRKTYVKTKSWRPLKILVEILRENEVPVDVLMMMAKKLRENEVLTIFQDFGRKYYLKTKSWATF